MKTINKLKLSQLNKDSMESRQMSQIMGGNYCAWGDENRDANGNEGKCSCVCNKGEDYYGTYGINADAWLFKYCP